MKKWELIDKAKASGKKYIATGFVEDGVGNVYAIDWANDDNLHDMLHDINKKHGQVLFTDDLEQAEKFAAGEE